MPRGWCFAAFGGGSELPSLLPFCPSDDLTVGESGGAGDSERARFCPVFSGLTWCGSPRAFCRFQPGGPPGGAPVKCSIAMAEGFGVVES